MHQRRAILVNTHGTFHSARERRLRFHHRGRIEVVDHIQRHSLVLILAPHRATLPKLILVRVIPHNPPSKGGINRRVSGKCRGIPPSSRWTQGVGLAKAMPFLGFASFRFFHSTHLGVNSHAQKRKNPPHFRVKGIAFAVWTGLEHLYFMCLLKYVSI
jgi:hypothetical protein